MSKKRKCPKEVLDLTLDKIRNNRLEKVNLIWIEACGCAGDIIALLDGNNPDMPYFFSEMVNMTYNNSLMGSEGQKAFEKFLETLDTEFILAVEGAVTVRDNGIYDIIAEYNGKSISGAEAITLASGKAKYILAIGTCAAYGGISAAKPNPSMSMSLQEFLGKEVIRVPGCPANPQWITSTIAHLISYGIPELDSEGRPKFLYGETIHTNCERRSYFDRQIFAEKLGDKECMYRLGCKGPITRADCPIVRWDDGVNWPVGANTPCIGCASKGFPDENESFIKL
ncbi:MULTISPECIES: hydrogenase small subunit [Clostridium]|uniref:Hydrogenase small subunit n=1 Tax=Clostridium cadaveris TaxID=1529 RepID=A0A1I2JNP6_9CLOT|nr:hydrogenase small subunit [Clostridium cadaveris]MDU4953612.1 hydrogenase small subunit [Clostridium sp.]MDM8312685.1 hydrogenase small subunit [Clostridium cadaveris]MDY4948105.1 hydrogenase small subunit [Clostridium cadaveris]NME66151.1 hydrogenase small subunit [Clostridium cadaveris]NWK11107.1 hydrogenase small subunit [Clostridium cadaveris]